MTEKESILKNAAKAFIDSLKGRFFTVTFQKADGSLTTRCAQKFRQELLSGGPDKLAKTAAIPFVDVNKKAFRSFNVNRLVKIQSGDKVFNPSEIS